MILKRCVRAEPAKLEMDGLDGQTWNHTREAAQKEQFK
jgi:hypothetical protein